MSAQKFLFVSGVFRPQWWNIHVFGTFMRQRARAPVRHSGGLLTERKVYGWQHHPLVRRPGVLRRPGGVLTQGNRIRSDCLPRFLPRGSVGNCVLSISTHSDTQCPTPTPECVQVPLEHVQTLPFSATGRATVGLGAQGLPGPAGQPAVCAVTHRHDDHLCTCEMYVDLVTQQGMVLDCLTCVCGTG